AVELRLRLRQLTRDGDNSLLLQREPRDEELRAKSDARRLVEIRAQRADLVDHIVEAADVLTLCADRSADGEDESGGEKCALHHFTTVSVTSTLVTSPLTLSVAVVNWPVCPSFRIIELLARNDRNDGCCDALPASSIRTDVSSMVSAMRKRPASSAST